MRTGRRLHLALALGAVATVFGLAVTAPGRSQDMRVYDRYSDVRQELKSCQFAVANGTLNSTQRRRCNRLDRRYVLYAWPGNTAPLHVHCVTSRCIATPTDEPPADRPMPSGSTTYEWPPR